MESDIFKKFEKSVDLKDRKIYLSNRRIIDFNGVLIGFFDTNYSIQEYSSNIGVGEELEYISPEDFESMCDFKCQLNEYLKQKGELK